MILEMMMMSFYNSKIKRKKIMKNMAKIMIKMKKIMKN